MSATVRLQADGRMVEVPAGASVAAAVAQATLQFRQSSSGQARAPLCGMGVCFECRVRIDGVGQQRACLVDACDGMQVRTDG
ncbi:2Fe-2S iron-sulfur cluster-binding protein [Xanthomonas perforans]|uniref:2Fe-2S iron-sulfur cluster-binding protein n=1 Tax=Xanthomonas perforans TaxID=442694 RepID=UPI00115CAEB7|nr:2Fe-2S iron-sulfur cluster-binding protein [Xanthomonas perforans]TQT21045.1 (2Fe-2S)-binding protein [Xanthomonas perforans]